MVIILAVFAISCSSEGGAGGELNEWSVVEGEQQTFPVGNVGAVDEERFYAMRGRSGGVRQLRAYSRSDGSVMWSQGVRGPCQPPIVTRDIVFCPGSDLFAFEAESGNPIWELQSDNSFALVSGTADERRVFAGTLTEAIAADARTGQVLWRRNFTGGGWVGVGLRSFTLDGGDLLVSMDAKYSANGFFSSSVVFALDPETGEERWRFEDGGPDTDKSIGTLTVWENLVLFSDGRQEFTAFDRQTRRVVWRVETAPGFLGTRRAPAVADGVAYFATGTSIYAVNARSGAAIWAASPQNASYFSHDVCGPLLLANNSGLTLMNREDGSVRGFRFGSVNESVGQTAVADGFAYVSTLNAVYALDCNAAR